MMSGQKTHQTRRGVYTNLPALFVLHQRFGRNADENKSKEQRKNVSIVALCNGNSNIVNIFNLKSRFSLIFLYFSFVFFTKSLFLQWEGLIHLACRNS
jgi:hypothetical protein